MFYPAKGKNKGYVPGQINSKSKVAANLTDLNSITKDFQL
jgi:hypothetical protein